MLRQNGDSLGTACRARLSWTEPTWRPARRMRVEGRTGFFPIRIRRLIPYW